jgi:hypothetical protein
VLVLVLAVLVVGACSDEGDDTSSPDETTQADEVGGGDDASGPLCEADVIVFLTPGIDDATIDGVQAALDDAAEVDRSELVDQAGTQPVYQALFADALPAEDPAHQPQSFAVVLRGNVDATLFVTELYGTEGVGEVAPVDGQACQIASGEIDLDSP